MGTQNTLAASGQPKKGRLYAVIQVKENGKAKAVWRSLGLPLTRSAPFCTRWRRTITQAGIGVP